MTMPCALVELNQCFRGTCCLLLVFLFMLFISLTLKIEAVPSSETPLSSAALHNIISQMIVLFKSFSVRFRKKIIKILHLFQNINILTVSK